MLQSLVVTKASTKGKGAFEVVAGGRRFAALQRLREQGMIKASFEVACTIIEAESAVAASLSENTLRQAMHAADQFEAFRKLVDAGRSVEDVAALLSVTPLEKIGIPEQQLNELKTAIKDDEKDGKT